MSLSVNADLNSRTFGYWVASNLPERRGVYEAANRIGVDGGRGGGVARGAAGESAHRATMVAHTPNLAALIGAFLFVGGLMLVAKKDAFTVRERGSNPPAAPKAK